MADKGHCEHGEFDLSEGCPKCMVEQRAAHYPTNIVKVRYAEGSREYSYYSEDRLKVGDIVMVQVRDRLTNATVTAVNVPEAEVEAFKDKVKTIPADSVIPPDAKVNSPENIKKRIEAVQPGEGSTGTPPSTFGRSTTGDLPGPEPTEAEEKPKDLFPCMSMEGKAVLKVDPGMALSFVRHLESAKRVLEIAASREIITEADAKSVNDDLNIMASLEKAVDEERKTFTVPLNDYLGSINGSYKLITGPLGEAKQIYRRLLTDWKVGQQRKAAEVERLNQDAINLARRQAEASGTGEFTVETKPVPVPFAPKLTRTDQGKSGLVDRWKYEVVDIDLLPREYMIPDDDMLKSIAKTQHDKKSVKGVRFYNSPSLRVTR